MLSSFPALVGRLPHRQGTRIAQFVQRETIVSKPALIILCARWVITAQAEHGFPSTVRMAHMAKFPVCLRLLSALAALAAASVGEVLYQASVLRVTFAEADNQYRALCITW